METVWTERMPNLTAAQKRLLRVVTGQALPEDMRVVEDGIPDDVALHIRELQTKNNALESQIAEMMKTLMKSQEKMEEMMNTIKSGVVVRPPKPAVQAQKKE